MSFYEGVLKLVKIIIVLLLNFALKSYFQMKNGAHYR